MRRADLTRSEENGSENLTKKGEEMREQHDKTNNSFARCRKTAPDERTYLIFILVSPKR